MSKQDIEKRLGFAAQGVKETTRTSAKAAFDLTGNELDNRIAPTMHSLGHFVEVKVPQLKQNIADAAKYAKKAYDSGKRIMQSATASPQEIREFERQVSVAKALPGWRIANSENFSRPGVKAKFATEVGRKGNKSAMISRDATGTWYAYVVQRIETGIGKDEDMLGTMRSYSTEARAKAAALRGLETSGLRGGFSRPGVKADMAIGSYKQGDRTVTVNGKKYEVLPYQMDFFIKELATLDTPEWRADVVKEYLRRGYIKSTASRPGVKAKFEKEYVLWGLPKGETDAIHQQVLSTQAKTPAQMEDVKKRAAAAGWHSFRVQILDLSKPYKGFARPGVKAKFDTKVGSKGNKSAMIAKNGPDADASWLAWVVQHHGEGQGESVLGTMRSYSTEARAKAAALRGLETSGLRGGFSRPGVKAKFELRAQKIMGDGRVYLDLKKAKEWLSSENNKALEQIISSAKANSDKESRGGVDGPKFNYYADLAMMAQEILKSNKREGRMQASRPGVKAKMGSSQVNDSATTADLIREAQRLRDVIKTSNREFDKTHLRQIKQELDRRGVLMPYGASEVLASRPTTKAKA